MNSGVAGQTTWTTRDKTPVDRSFDPVPEGDYIGTINAEKMDIRRNKEDPESVPRAGGMFVTLEELTDAQGTPRRVYVDLFCSLKPIKKKDGTFMESMAEKSDGLLGLLKNGLGEDVDFDQPGAVLTWKSAGKNSNAPYLNPKHVIEVMKGFNGRRIGLHVEIEPAKGGYKAKNRVTRWYIPEGEEAGPTEYTGEDDGNPAEEPVEQEYEANGAEEGAMQEEVVEAPPPKIPPARKPAPAPARKPLPKHAAKKR
jgi:hypothetical protein